MSNGTTTFAIHVDCDPPWIYEREYGVPVGNADAIYWKALPAFLQLFGDLGVKATFFVIGKELDLPACSSFCRRALDEGHTLGNHSYTHPVDFAGMTSAERAWEIGRAHSALSALGHVPVAYRSPGYFNSNDINRTLSDLGYLCNSSILPGPASLLMALYLRARGQAKEKSFGVRQNLFASRAMYRRESGLIEVPVAVIPIVRMPIHSTFIYQFGRRYLDAGLFLLRRSAGHHVLLFHAIDMLDSPAAPTSPIIPLRWSAEARRDLVTHMIREVRSSVVLTERCLLS